MISRGVLVLTFVSNCVLSLPLTPSQMENEDVKVMKCIVETLADVLSQPHPAPVSQECLVTLKTDDRLIFILRHHNFLKELQEIAVQGGQERAQLQRDASTTDPPTPAAQTEGEVPDRSMLEALGGPGERSILSQEQRGGDGHGEEEKSQEDSEVKREKDQRLGSLESVEEREEDEESEDKRVKSEENMSKEKEGEGAGERRENKPKEKKFDEEEKDKRSPIFSHKQVKEQQQEKEEKEEQKDEGEMEKRSRESLRQWAKRGKALSLKKKAVEKGEQQEVPHHSKEDAEEVVEEVEEKKKKRDPLRSPEEKELQMIARGRPEEKTGEEEEEGSAKTEEPEIESLAAIESELENVAQKLHDLRRG